METTVALIKMFVGINVVDNSQHMGIILMNSDGRLRAASTLNTLSYTVATSDIYSGTVLNKP